MLKLNTGYMDVTFCITCLICLKHIIIKCHDSVAESVFRYVRSQAVGGGGVPSSSVRDSHPVMAFHLAWVMKWLVTHTVA